MIFYPFVKLNGVAKWGVDKKKSFYFIFKKKKEKNQVDIDVVEATISVRSKNPYKFPLIKSSILFLLICKLFTTLIFIWSNHASSHFDSSSNCISRIHHLVPSKCNGLHHIGH